MAAKDQPSPRRQTVHPVAGMYLTGIPQAPIIADAATAKRLVRTGAYTREGGSNDDASSVELTPEQIGRLDHYDNVTDKATGGPVDPLPTGIIAGEAGPESLGPTPE